MRTFFFSLLGVAMALPLVGQEETAEGNPPSAREVHRQRLIKRFDKDGDGKLDDEEREAMRSFIEERRKNGGQRRGRRPIREDVLKEFDKDEDGKLSEEERRAMHEEMSKRHRGRKGHGKAESANDE